MDRLGYAGTAGAVVIVVTIGFAGCGSGDVRMPPPVRRPPMIAAPTEPFPMATPWECRAVPSSLGADPNHICNLTAPPAEPTDLADAAVPVAASAPAPPQVTAGLVATALRQVPLPAPVIHVQLPGGRTPINFDTNFFTEAGNLTRTVTLLGQRVDLQITAAAYAWSFGDGQAVGTTRRGTAYPDLDITHRYLGSGEVVVRVDMTCTAQFSVSGGDFAPVPGTVTVTGASEPLHVGEARPTLAK